jgi:hypothetical protein
LLRYAHNPQASPGERLTDIDVLDYTGQDSREKKRKAAMANLQGYRIDCYLPDGQCEARDFEAQDDKAAVAEAEKIARWVKPVRFEVRQITNGQRVIYRSPD